MRTAEERDRSVLAAVRALVRFFGVVAGTLCALAAADLAVGVPAGLHGVLLLLAVLVGGVAALTHLLRVARGSRARS